MSITIDLDTAFCEARKHLKDEILIRELNELEIFLEDDGYDIDLLKKETEMREIRKSYLLKQNHSFEARHVFNKIVNIIGNPHKNTSSSLLHKQINNKFDHFTKLVDFQKTRSAFVTRNDSYITVDKYIRSDYRYLKPLEKVSVKCQIPISEYLVTGYHQSALNMNQYIAENELFNQLKQKYHLSPTHKAINKAHESMVNYLNEYEKAISKPLPNSKLDKINTSYFNDDITVIINYITEINSGIHNILSNNAAYPIQLDVFFVAPKTHTDLNLHSLGGLGEDVIKSDRDSRKNGAVDAIADIYHLLRRAANIINRSNGQRFIMLIARENEDDSSCDTVYIYKPRENGSIPPQFISDNVELTYLLNSKLSPIIPGLLSSDDGVLGLTHHLHSEECNKVYLSYGDYKSRIFKSDILNKLQILFNWHNHRRHCIGNITKTDFMSHYEDFIDIRYDSIGSYWFNNSKQYECFEPHWNPQNCRAMGNVFIPKQNPSCTDDLNKYIDEDFESAEKLYYKMDYTVGMQIVDKQTIYIKFKNGDGICLINTELHKNGQLLYAVIVENTFKSKQRWKIIDYKDISKAFMTAQQLHDEYGIFKNDLPKGSKAKHHNFKDFKDRIEVTKQLIRTTNWSHIRIVQSKQNLGKLGLHNIHNNGKGKGRRKYNGKYHGKYHGKHHGNNIDLNEDKNGNGNGNGVLMISERRFKQLALKSLTNISTSNESLTPIAHFKFRKNRYHLEKLLPVFIPEHNKYVAISFWYNQLSDKGRTQASGVCLDLTDMKNKANLIDDINSNSWLNKANDDMTINNLTIGKEDTPPTVTKITATTTTATVTAATTTKTTTKAIKQQQQKPQKQQKQQQQQQLYASAKVPTAYVPKQQQQPQQQQQQQPIYVPSKVPTAYIPKQPQQQQSIPQQMIYNNNINNNNNNMYNIQQSVPQLFASSSIPTLQSVPSMIPQQSLPTISLPTYQSVPNMPNMPNMHQYRQNAQYFGNIFQSLSINNNNHQFISQTVTTNNNNRVSAVHCYPSYNYGTTTITHSPQMYSNNNVQYNNHNQPLYNNNNTMNMHYQ